MKNERLLALLGKNNKSTMVSIMYLRTKRKVTQEKTPFTVFFMPLSYISKQGDEHKNNGLKKPIGKIPTGSVEGCRPQLNNYNNYLTQN